MSLAVRTYLSRSSAGLLDLAQVFIIATDSIGTGWLRAAILANMLPNHPMFQMLFRSNNTTGVSGSFNLRYLNRISSYPET